MEVVQEIIEEREIPRRKLINAGIAQQHFRRSVLEAAAEISNEFTNHYWKEVSAAGDPEDQRKLPPPTKTEALKKGFVVYLNASGRYLVIREHLRSAVAHIVQQRCLNLRTSGFQSHRDFQCFLHDTYNYLVDEVHESLSRTALPEVDPLHPVPFPPKSVCDPNAPMSSKDLEHKKLLRELLFYSEECFSQNDYEGCHRLHLQRICRSKEHPTCWVDFALMWLQKGEDRMAEIAVREAIRQNTGSVHALVVGGLLAIRHNDDRGIDCIVAALEMKPFCPELLVILGLVLAISSTGDEFESDYFFRKAAHIRHLLTGKPVGGLDKTLDKLTLAVGVKESVTDINLAETYYPCMVPTPVESHEDVPNGVAEGEQTDYRSSEASLHGQPKRHSLKHGSNPHPQVFGKKASKHSIGKASTPESKGDDENGKKKTTNVENTSSQDRQSHPPHHHRHTPPSLHHLHHGKTNRPSLDNGHENDLESSSSHHRHSHPHHRHTPPSLHHLHHGKTHRSSLDHGHENEEEQDDHYKAKKSHQDKRNSEVHHERSSHDTHDRHSHQSTEGILENYGPGEYNGNYEPVAEDDIVFPQPDPNPEDPYYTRHSSIIDGNPKRVSSSFSLPDFDFTTDLSAINVHDAFIRPLRPSVFIPWDITAYSEKLLEMMTAVRTVERGTEMDIPNSATSGSGIAPDSIIKAEYDKLISGTGDTASVSGAGDDQKSKKLKNKPSKEKDVRKKSTTSSKSLFSSKESWMKDDEEEKKDAEGTDEKPKIKYESCEEYRRAMLEMEPMPIYTDRLGSELIWTAQLLLQMRMFDMVDCVLTRELYATEKRSIQYIFLRAMSLYLRQWYYEAMPFLEEGILIDPENPVFWMLKGHCHYESGDNESAASCYETTLKLPYRNENRHLMYLRYGNMELGNNNIDTAKRILLYGLHKYPTPSMWLAVGNACYAGGEYEQAEIAFSEANRLDNTNPITWAHLSLINLIKDRQSLAEQSYKWAIRFGLKKGKIMEVIKKLQQEKGFGDPSFPRAPNCIPHDYYVRRFGRQKPFEIYREALLHDVPNFGKKRFDNTKKEIELKEKLQTDLQPPSDDIDTNEQEVEVEVEAVDPTSPAPKTSIKEEPIEAIPPPVPIIEPKPETEIIKQKQRKSGTSPNPKHKSSRKTKPNVIINSPRHINPPGPVHLESPKPFTEIPKMIPKKSSSGALKQARK